MFNTLTRGHAETGGYGGLQLNVGVVKVPDERLDRLAEVFKPKKIVHADVTYVDLPAPPASTEGQVGAEELPAEHLARLRDSDALIHVVRAWDSAASRTRPGRWTRPATSSSSTSSSSLADLAMVDRRLERLRGPGATGRRPSARRTSARRSILERLKPALEAGPPIRDVALDADEEKAIRGFRFLTQKPVLVLLNVGEGGHRRGAGARRADPRRLRRTGTRMVDALSARIEMELGELEPDEAAVFMEELGLAESCARPRDRPVLPAASGLISFLTAGPDEVRAWPIPDGSTAVDAAGAIHTDLAQGLHPRRDDRLRGPARARVDGRGEEARQGALGGQDLPGRATAT